MGYEVIQAGEVDANSPGSATLLSKIRNCILFFYSNLIKVSELVLLNVPDCIGARIYDSHAWGAWGGSPEDYDIIIPVGATDFTLIVYAKASAGGPYELRPTVGSYTGASTGSLSSAGYTEYTWNFTSAGVSATGKRTLTIQGKGSGGIGELVYIKKVWLRTK